MPKHADPEPKGIKKVFGMQHEAEENNQENLSRLPRRRARTKSEIRKPYKK
jgi:hypothetical protein